MAKRLMWSVELGGVLHAILQIMIYGILCAGGRLSRSCRCLIAAKKAAAEDVIVTEQAFA
jgi:hypothetical protein